MKIYSWNVLRSNRNLPEVYSFIENLDFDILCLQEVTEEMLVVLKGMPFHIAFNIDRHAQLLRPSSKSRIDINYAVILSRYKIRTEGKIQFPPLLRSFNSNTFEYFFQRIQKWESVTNLGSVYADVEIEGKLIRVFSVHLALWNPKTRVNEFKHLMEYLPQKGPAIICGDLNILESGPIKILNWFLGGSLYEGMPWYPERKLFEERFKFYGLQNPLISKITHRFSRSQLDHILLSREFKIATAKVEDDSHGSDHQPVFAETYLEA